MMIRAVLLWLAGWASSTWAVAYGWFTERTSRTWTAHGLVSLAAAVSAGIVVGWLDRDPLLGMALGATGSFLSFWLKEAGDERKHRASGQWHKPQTGERVTPAVDRRGDLLGPRFVMLTAWAAWVLS